MKVAYNQNNLRLSIRDSQRPCDNCIFTRPENRSCILFDFGEDNFGELPGCWNGVFIPKPLSNIFEL